MTWAARAVNPTARAAGVPVRTSCARSDSRWRSFYHVHFRLSPQRNERHTFTAVPQRSQGASGKVFPVKRSPSGWRPGKGSFRVRARWSSSSPGVVRPCAPAVCCKRARTLEPVTIRGSQNRNDRSDVVGLAGPHLSSREQKLPGEHPAPRWTATEGTTGKTGVSCCGAESDIFRVLDTSATNRTRGTEFYSVGPRIVHFAAGPADKPTGNPTPSAGDGCLLESDPARSDTE